MTEAYTIMRFPEKGEVGLKRNASFLFFRLRVDVTCRKKTDPRVEDVKRHTPTDFVFLHRNSKRTKHTNCKRFVTHTPKYPDKKIDEMPHRMPPQNSDEILVSVVLPQWRVFDNQKVGLIHVKQKSTFILLALASVQQRIRL